MSQLAIVYQSGFGHTAVLAEAVADGAREEGARVASVTRQLSAGRVVMSAAT